MLQRKQNQSLKMAQVYCKVLFKFVLLLEIGVQTGLNLFRLYLLYNKSGTNREFHLRFCERFRYEMSLYLLGNGLCYLDMKSSTLKLKIYSLTVSCICKGKRIFTVLPTYFWVRAFNSSCDVARFGNKGVVCQPPYLPLM